MQKKTDFLLYLKRFRNSRSNQIVHRVSMEMCLCRKPINSLEELLEYGRAAQISPEWLEKGWEQYQKAIKEGTVLKNRNQLTREEQLEVLGMINKIEKDWHAVCDRISGLVRAPVIDQFVDGSPFHKAVGKTKGMLGLFDL